MNLVLFGELMRHCLFETHKNVVYRCHWENFDAFDTDECLYYTHFLGNSFIVYFCSIFVNVACVRTIIMTEEKVPCRSDSCKECGVNCPKKRKTPQCAEDWLAGKFVSQSFPDPGDFDGDGNLLRK